MNTQNWRSMSEQELSELFRKLGAREPESWAHSQVTEGIPQLARYLFLRQAWREIIGPNDHNWMAEVRPKDADEPGGEIGPALDRLIATGARVEDITTVVRVMQWWLLSGLCERLEDPGDLEPEVANICWQLFLVDENNKPMLPIQGLIESVLETDPTGREMRPPDAPG